MSKDTEGGRVSTVFVSGSEERSCCMTDESREDEVEGTKFLMAGSGGVNDERNSSDGCNGEWKTDGFTVS